MKNPQEIQYIAMERLEEATILCDNGKYDGAFYLAGYSIELMLKAKICERWGIPNLFDEQYQAHGIAEIRKAVKTHDVAVLLVFSGLKAQFDVSKSIEIVLALTNVRLFASSGRCLWNEQVRYHPCGSQNPEDVQELLKLLQHEEGLLRWIEKN